jgi:hypothetical protein
MTPLRRGWTACAAVALGCLVAAPSAQAAFTVGGSAAPTDPTSGANSNFNININFGGGTSQAESVEDLTVHLPPGLVGNPGATPLCTVAQLNADNCPDNTQVGSVSSVVDPLGLPAPITVDGALYNLVPQSGEPARFGIVLRPDVGNNIVLQSGARLRKDDFGLDSVVTGIPNTANLGLGSVPIHINSQTLTLFGEAPTGNAFLRNPTSCGSQTTGFEATSHGGESASAEATFNLSGCQSLPFNPKLTGVVGAPGRTEPATKPPMTTVIEQKDGEAGLQRAQVVLPAGVGAVAGELGNTCPLASFQASKCPANSIIGSAESESPLLDVPLAGDVSIVDALPGELPQLGVDLKGPLAIQIRGNFILVPGPGNVFEGLPDIPISRFELKFKQDKLISTTRDLCEPPVPLFSTDFLGYNGVRRTGSAEAEVAGCTPTAKVTLSKSRSKHPRLKAEIKGGGSTLRKAKIKLPRQLKFASKRAFKRGTKATGDDGKLGRSALKRGARSVKVSATNGSTTLTVSARKHAVKRVKKVKKGKALRFPITVEDAGGFKTKLEPTATAK